MELQVPIGTICV